MAEVAVKEFKEIKLVGFRVLCEGDKYIEEIPKAANQLKQRTDEINSVLNNGRQIGAFITEERTPEDEGYWIGVEVSKYIDVPKDMVTLTIPANRYATILHDGPNYFIRNSYEILHKWIKEQSLDRANFSWNIEIYNEVKNQYNPDNVQVKLCDSIY
ncbi:GyrI-like domain-containing protein [Bacillus sp. FJAT-49711]|uniref:GyrI-like domain-containing protein n=1 Tax=Bacillus sp. FJAT-49711 TaxID=2833585 RepID=UPI001BC997C6|nr:GyrI-like domain-containing protein [Bacillus sp. FJAT-49711]MBS4219999.1 GyrI-like domain-containing protein [Bacillus sp. FJAT-49711]